MTDKRPFKERLVSNQYVIGAFATIGGGLFGLDISSMSAQLNNPSYLSQFNYPNSNLQGGITASMPAGSFGGSLICSYLSDKIGRRPTIMLAGSLWVLGSIIQSASYNVRTLVAGRVISGLSIGLASSCVPMFIAEQTKPSLRGRMVSIQQWAITWGIFLQFFVQYGCSFIDGTASFRLPWGLQLIPAVVLVIGMIFLPETPRWLMDHDRNEEALKLLASIHGGGDPNNELVQLEYNEIKDQIDFDRTQAARSYADLVKPGIFRRVALGCAIQMWSQLCGMNIMMYYVLYVAQSAGITGRRGSLIVSSVQWVLNVVMTVPAIVYIDRWGRRPMLVGGAVSMCFFLFLVGGLMQHYGHFDPTADPYQTTTWVITGHKAATRAIIACSISSFALLPSPGDLAPGLFRPKYSLLVNWAFNFALAYFGPVALRNIRYKTYYLFGTFCAAGAINMFFCLPETRGRTLEEMEEIFNAGHVFTAWKIKSDVGKHTLEDVLASRRSPNSKHADFDHEEKAGRDSMGTMISPMDEKKGSPQTEKSKFAV
ncbi:general substrate transporter [Meredithblackwellia eburnea MCA 4105]